MHPQMVKLLLYCPDVIIITVNCIICIANEQVSNLAMVIIQTVNNIYTNLCSSRSSKIVYYSVTYQIYMYIKIYIHKTKLYLISSQ